MNIETEILQGILSIIETISDPQFQQKAWVENAVNPYASFEESMHHLFDDYEIASVINNYEIYGISNSQYTNLNKFYKDIDRYSNEKMSWLDSADPKEILADPRWHEIQKLAKEVLEAFHYTKSNNKEP